MIIDILFLLIMIFAIYRGFRKGFIVGVFSMIAFIIGLAAALKLSIIVANYFKNAGNFTSRWLPVLSFILVFIIVVLLINLGARLIEKTLKVVMLGWLNKLGGILLYASLYIIIFSIFLFFAEKSSVMKPGLIQQSQVYAYISPWGPKVIDNFGKIIPLFKDMFAQLEGFFDSIAKKAS